MSTRPRQRYAQFRLGSTVDDLIKQLNEETRDNDQLFNAMIEGEFFTMRTNTNALPLDVSTSISPPRGVIAVQCLNVSDPTDNPVIPGIHWTYSNRVQGFTVKVLDGLAADTIYTITLLIMGGKARGTGQPIPQNPVT